jgi:hypothetical protein
MPISYARARATWPGTSALMTHIEANHVYLIFAFYTGDAAGQNMVTFCTAAICAGAHRPRAVRATHAHDAGAHGRVLVHEVIGGVQTGSIGVSGHISNGIADS